MHRVNTKTINVLTFRNSVIKQILESDKLDIHIAIDYVNMIDVDYMVKSNRPLTVEEYYPSLKNLLR
jgi:hypothetical protein